jgi:hypothetical protein
MLEIVTAAVTFVVLAWTLRINLQTRRLIRKIETQLDPEPEAEIYELRKIERGAP